MSKGRAFHSKLAGVAQANDDGRSRQYYIDAYCAPGMQLSLRREPGNRVDRNAVSVWIRARLWIVFKADVQIGYLSAQVAEELAPLMDAGRSVTAQVTAVTGGTRGKPIKGVNCRIELEA
jgi:hypothetical protein